MLFVAACNNLRECESYQSHLAVAVHWQIHLIAQQNQNDTFKPVCNAYILWNCNLLYPLYLLIWKHDSPPCGPHFLTIFFLCSHRSLFLHLSRAVDDKSSYLSQRSYRQVVSKHRHKTPWAQSRHGSTCTQQQNNHRKHVYVKRATILSVIFLSGQIVCLMADV